MKVAIVSTWPPDRCGIAEYSKNLLTGLNKCLASGDKIEAIHKNIVQVTPVELKNFDVVHFENQGSFWSGEWFEKTLKYLKDWEVRTVVTFHDSAYWDGFNGFKYIDLAIAHRQDILDAMPIVNHTAVMPMPIPEYPVKICGFGIGRSDHKLVGDICRELGYLYFYRDPAIAPWLEQNELIEWIKEFDGVALWYKDYGKLKGSSAGARMAMAARRPLFLSDINWFDDLKQDVGTGRRDIRFCKDPASLKSELFEYFANWRLENNNFSKAAELHYNLYKKLTEGSL